MQISLKSLFRQMTAFRREFIAGNLLAFLATLASIPIPLLIPVLIDEIILKKPGWLLALIDRSLGPGGPVYYTLVVLAAVVFLRVLSFVLNVAQNRLFKKIAKQITFQLRSDLLNHLGRATMADFESMGAGSINSHLTTDINTVDDFIGITVGRLVISALTVLGVAVVLIWIHPLLAIFIFLLNPAVALLTLYMGKKVAVLKKEENRALEIFQESLVATIDLFGQIRASNKEKRYIKEVIANADQVRHYAVQFGYKSDAANRFSFLFFMTGYEIFRAISILLVMFSSLSIGLMLAIFGYIWFIMGPVQEILNIQFAFHNAEMALQRLNRIFLLRPEPAYPHLHNPFTGQGAAVRLERICFSYSAERPVFEELSLHIAARQKVAIVGPSGSGKTTLAQILVGFYPVDSGQLFFNDIEVSQIGLDRVRENVGLVLQNPQLFNDSIRQNLALGQAVPENTLWQALGIAQLESMVRALPEGLDTKLGKNGIRLSGGQRQRLALARILVANPDIVILDESTSALDSETEFNLFESLQQFFADKTVIIIAHRLSTILNADYIYVLDHGQIIQQGKPEVLAAEEGLYQKLLRRQLG